MADNIILNPGIGGDTTRAEDTGLVKIPVIKIHTGELGIDDGPVTAANPLAVGVVGSITAIGPLTDVQLRASDVPVSDPLTTASYGVWDYKAGVDGTPVFGVGSRIRSIVARSLVGGTLSINGGDNIPIPPTVGLEINPQGLIVSPVLVFTNTDMYFVEYVT